MVMDKSNSSYLDCLKPLALVIK